MNLEKAGNRNRYRNTRDTGDTRIRGPKTWICVFDWEPKLGTAPEAKTPESLPTPQPSAVSLPQARDNEPSISSRLPFVPVKDWTPKPIPDDACFISGIDALKAMNCDPLYLGLRGLTGKVPPNWTKDGWIMSIRDRMSRTDDPVALDRFRAELLALGVTEPDSTSNIRRKYS